MRIEMHGLVIAYDLVGQGTPLLLIHGYPLSRLVWQPQLGELFNAGQIIAPDLRGHGETAGPPPASVDGFAADCLALLEALDIRRPVVVGGLSMGGYVALAFARLYPKLLAGLLLTATRAGADSADAKAARDNAAATARVKGAKTIADAMLPKMFAPHTYQDNPELVERVRGIMEGTSVEGIVGALAAMRDRPDSTPLLEHIAVPALVLHGAEDQLIPPSEAEAMHVRLRNSRLQIIPNAGHLLNMENPPSFNAAVRNFVETL